MNTEVLEEIVACSSGALAARKKIARLHASYIARETATRAAVTTYNARVSSIMEIEVAPREKRLREILGSVSTP